MLRFIHHKWNNLIIYPELAERDKFNRTLLDLSELSDLSGLSLDKVEKINIENYKQFMYLLPNDYDNLICLTMIVKNAGPNFENILKSNLPFIDQWCILDTGSTDGTQEIIKRVLKDKRGKLYEEPFVNFKVSRNRCLDLAGTKCRFIIMLDDTYILKGNIRKFLEEVRGDTYADSFSLLIQSDDTEYYSNRIIKSDTFLRYIHTIHEVITDQNNVNVTIPKEEAYIYDQRSEYMESRTFNRKQFDLELLFKELENSPDDPRILYYIGQTYGCINDDVNKAVYFEKRIKLDGYVQEKIDALFELARTYNFKINQDTKEPITAKLSPSNWKRCEDLYLNAYILDTNRPDSLYFIGIHYYLDNFYEIAYYYFKKAFEIGYPINSQYALKPTLSFHFLPKFLSEICYYREDYNLGLSSAELFLNNNKPTDNSWNMMVNWYNIHKLLVKMPVISLNPYKKYYMCIVTGGGWEEWSGKDIETKGLGGSETWVIETARNNKDVIVFCNCKKSEIYNDVTYKPVNTFGDFISKNEVKHCIISRFHEYIPIALKGHTNNVYFIFHDMLTPEIVIPINKKIKLLFGLTLWHSKIIKDVFPQFNVSYNYYGIDELITNETKIKNNFIFSSFPNRGLVVLLKMWARIKEVFPDATLSVYCNLEQDWVNKIATDMMIEIKSLISQEGVTNYGWVSKKVLRQAWSVADYWLYPCIFQETFCHTALEAAISKTKVITNGLAALSETAKHGLLIPGNPLTKEWQDKCLESLKVESFSESLETNYNWAKTLSWKSQTENFFNKII